MKLKKLNPRGFSHDVLALFFVVVFSVAGVTYLVASHADPITASTSVLDVSSPQCGVLGSIGHHNFGIVGVNSTAADFSSNPCLASEVHHFSGYSLYTAANYPSSYCLSHGIRDPLSCGRHAASFAMGHAGATGVSRNAAGWWVDVETQGGWGGNQGANQQFLLGMWEQLSTSGKTVGFYSTQSQWSHIVGNWRSNHSPTWYATGIKSTSTPRGITGYCRNRFTQGSIKYVQYINTGRGGGIDVNVRC